MPNTRAPWLRSSCTAIRPISPRPVTTTVSPSVGPTSRMPCRAIAPATVKAAASAVTPSGMRAQRLAGTATISACLPFEATRSPGAKPVTPAPTSITLPALQ